MLGVGLGLRGKHYSHLLSQPTQTQWLEATTENYLGLAGANGGRPIRVLEKLRGSFPVVLHGVSLSIGSSDSLDFEYLRAVKDLMERIQPAWVSDHLCWTGVNGQNLHDLLPLPFTRETIDYLVDRIDQVQNFLGTKMIFENVSSYLTFSHSEMTEWEFISEVSEKSGSGILLDLNNVYVSSVNHGFDPLQYLKGIPSNKVGQFHLAGHSESEGVLPSFLIDTHDHDISEPVWDLYRTALRRFGSVSTLIERDGNIPDYLTIEAEVVRAKEMQSEIPRNIHDEVSGYGQGFRKAKSLPNSELDESGHHGFTRS
jgi:uncharacterized protein (UPF0276 family)